MPPARHAPHPPSGPQESRFAPDIFSFGRVLHARQLHHHPIGARLLNDGLRNPELIDAVAKSSNVLLYSRILYAFLSFRFKSGDHMKLSPCIVFPKVQVRDTSC